MGQNGRSQFRFLSVLLKICAPDPTSLFTTSLSDSDARRTYTYTCEARRRLSSRAPWPPRRSAGLLQAPWSRKAPNSDSDGYDDGAHDADDAVDADADATSAENCSAYACLHARPLHPAAGGATVARLAKLRHLSLQVELVALKGGEAVLVAVLLAPWSPAPPARGSSPHSSGCAARRPPPRAARPRRRRRQRRRGLVRLGRVGRAGWKRTGAAATARGRHGSRRTFGRGVVERRGGEAWWRGVVDEEARARE